MDRIKTRLIIAVTGRLSAAEDSNAKTDLIEELSENLYERYLDLIQAGVPEEEAYTRALGELGDVDELLEYLRSLGPDGELPRQEGSGFSRGFEDILRGAEDIVRETISQTKDAVDQAKIIVRNVSEKLKEKYPNGFEGRVQFHIDTPEAGQDQGEADPSCQDQPPVQEPSGEGSDRDWSFAVGYNKERGGFFCETGKSQPVTGTSLPSSSVKAVDIKLTDGDVNIHLLDDPQADISLEGDTEQLELRLSDSGVLSIRPGKTAASSFFFVRGLAAANIELYLPRRHWDFLQIYTANGDVEIGDGLEAGRLTVKTASGDLTFAQAVCGDVVYKASSGDLDARNLTGSIQAETSSGDILLTGQLDNVRIASTSGDAEIIGSAGSVKASTVSGSIRLDSDVLPRSMDLSTKSGDCQATLPAGEGFSLHIETISGDLHTDFSLVGPMGAKSGDAIYLDGGNRTFRMVTVSGDISLQER